MGWASTISEEASPSPVYGAGLEYQLGSNPLASSNLAASAALGECPVLLGFRLDFTLCGLTPLCGEISVRPG